MERHCDRLLTGGIHGEIYDTKQRELEGERLGGGGGYGEREVREAEQKCGAVQE